MANSKATKRALFMSMVSLLVCFTMLMGATFAWFTDTVQSTNNRIVAGNLDVELEYSTDMNTWNKVKEDTNIFKENALWEPGYSEVVYLRVSNDGSLALKYKLGINVAEEIIGKTKAGADIKLSDYIEYGVIENVTVAYAETERMKARNDIGVPEKLNVAYDEEYELKAGDPAHTFALVAYMPESVTNDANHNGTDIPEIKLGLTVLATQLTAEYDSFDDQYDKDSKYPRPGYTAVYSADSIKESFDDIQDGESIKLYLSENITIDKPIVLNSDADVELDLAGCTLEGDVDKLISAEAGTISIKNGIIKNVNDSATETQVSVALSGNAEAEITDVEIETTGIGVLLENNAKITELNANVKSYVNANGTCDGSAIVLRSGNARIDLISGGEYTSTYSDEFIDAYSGSFSGMAIYPISVNSKNASIGEISGGTFLGRADDGRNGATIYVNAGKIEKISGGYFGFCKYTLRNYPYFMITVNTGNGASIDAITGGTFEYASGFGCDFENIVAQSGSKIEKRDEKATVSVKLSTSVKTKDVEIWDVVAK